MKNQYDVVVGGARCAGAATALLLSRAGARVLVVDRGTYGTDTLSTLTIEPRLGVDAFFAPRRTLLDTTLVDAAIASGATFEYGVKLTDVIRGGDERVNGVILRTPDGDHRAVRARLVIGADGLYSTVASRVSAPDLRRGEHAAAVLYAYWPAESFQGYQWFYRPGVSVGAIPTNDAACVFVAVPSHRFRENVGGDVRAAYHRLLAQAAPHFYETLGDPRDVEHVRGFGGHVSVMRACHGPGWALVGDAGYFKDPLTAHGITDALRDAELVARAALDDTDAAFAQYQATRNELSETLFDVTDAIASCQWDDERLAGAASLAESGDGARSARARRSGATQMPLTIGQRATRSLTLTADHVRLFAEISGDRNPLHFDEAFAASTKFGRLVVQGGLTTGLLHALVAMDMPGPGTVFLSQNWRFTAPVYIGDTITAHAEVVSVHASKPVTELRVDVVRQDGEKVLDGTAWCYTFPGPK